MTYDPIDTDADGTVEANVDNALTNTDELYGRHTNNVWVADPSATDIGAEIQSLHDNECVNGDTIFVPPGEYHNQQTPIVLSKWVNLESTGGWRNPGARIFKQGDFVALTTTHADRPSGSAIGEGGHSLGGVRFDGADVADASHGVVIHSTVEGTVAAAHHGGHGVFFENSDDTLHNSNWSDLTLEAFQNDGNGCRVENTAGTAINLNDMDLTVTLRANGDTGLYHRDGYDNTIRGDSEGNEGKGWDLGGERLFAVLRNESNEDATGTPLASTLTAPQSVVISKSQIGKWDHTQTAQTSVVQQGTTIRGEMGISALGIGDGASVSGGPVGDSGEFVELQSVRMHSSPRRSTTNTAYGNIIGNEEKVVIDWDELPLTNISDTYVSASMRLFNDTTGETTSFILMGDGGTIAASEVTHGGGFESVTTPRFLHNNTGKEQFKFDLKVSGGTGETYNVPVLKIWGEIA